MGSIRKTLIAGIVLFALLFAISVRAGSYISPDTIEVKYVDQSSSDYKTYVIDDSINTSKPVQKATIAKTSQISSKIVQANNIDNNKIINQQIQQNTPVQKQALQPIQKQVTAQAASPAQNRQQIPGTAIFPLNKDSYIKTIYPDLEKQENNFAIFGHLPYQGSGITLDTVYGWGFDSSFNYTINGYNGGYLWAPTAYSDVVKIYNSTTSFVFGAVDTLPNQWGGWMDTGFTKNTGQWQWTDNVSSSSSTTFKLVDMAGNVGFLVDSQNVIYKWNGATWSVQQSLGPIDDLSLYNSTLGFAVGPNGKLLKWTGTSWINDTNIVDSNTSISLQAYEFSAVKIVSPTLAFAVANHIQSSNPEVWCGGCCSVWPINDNAFVFREKIFKWNGTTWSVDYYHQSPLEENTCAIGYPATVQTSLYALDAVNGFALAVGQNGRVVKWNGASWQDYSGPDEAQMVNSTNRTVYWLPNTFTQNNLLSVAVLNSTFAYLGGDFPNLYLYKWAGSSFSQETYSLNPFAQAYLQQHPNSTTVYNSIVSHIDIASANKGYFTDRYMLYKLQDAPPSLNIPDQNLARNTPASLNLNTYASDPNGYTLTFSKVSDNPSKVSCSVAGSTLTMTPATNFTGSTTCAIAADNGNASTTDQFNINVIANIPDLAISTDDIQFTDTNPTNINITVHNNGAVASGSFDVQLLDVYRNQVVNTQTLTFGSIASGASATQTVNFGQFRGHTLKVYADPNDLIEEADETNNGAEKKFFNGDVYLDVNFMSNVDPLFTNYLKSKLTNYNVISNVNNAYYVIHVTNNYNPQNNFGCKDGKAYLNDKVGNLPYNGMINSVETNGQLHVFLCGADIDGFVAAVRNLNTLSLDANKPTFIDKDNVEGISVYDYMHLGSNLAAYTSRIGSGFTDLVNTSLIGRFGSTDETVKTNDNVVLRLKHLTPLQSGSFLDYLFGTYYYTSYSGSAPVVLARGLWSNVSDWQVLGKELAASGRDVWLAELTGGPNQDCDNCVDYTYNDLTDNYWPALVAGVMGYTGKSKVQYVGFSNGCRTGLDALRNWTGGKNNAGFIWQGSWVPVNLISNPVDTFVGVGCPGAFNGSSPVITAAQSFGNQATANLDAKNVHHVTMLDLVINIFNQDYFTDGSQKKISMNLWRQYNSWINSNSDNQPGTGLSVPKFTLIKGTRTLGNDDLVVPGNDMNQIYNAVSSANKTYYNVNAIHISLADKSETKEIIKNRINKG